MTVKELVKALKKMPQDLEVRTEGCDCYGDANGVKLLGNDVVITRDP